jgi:two-component sensor histidine kinase
LDIGGPDIAVTPKLVVAMSIILHELSTNAAKYGALSVENGRVRVSWSIVDGESPKVMLDWQESGGPLVAPPGRKGFGSRLIEGLLSGELGGSVRSDYDPLGLRCHIEASLDIDWATEPSPHSEELEA